MISTYLVSHGRCFPAYPNTAACCWGNKRNYRASLHVVRTHAQKEIQKHTTGGIPRWSPTLVLVARFSAYVWQSGRDAQFSLTYGRMYRNTKF
jgi:hypothetical protein